MRGKLYCRRTNPPLTKLLLKKQNLFEYTKSLTEKVKVMEGAVAAKCSGMQCNATVKVPSHSISSGKIYLCDMSKKQVGQEKVWVIL